MPVTLKDIADKAGYSIATVSRALAGYGDVNAKTRAYIVELALEMGYQPHVVARQLRNQRTDSIGMITTFEENDFSDDFFRQLMRGVGYAAARHGYDLLISTQAHPDSEMDAYRRIAGGKRVDGIVVARTRTHDPRIEYLKSIQHPFVVYGRGGPGESSDFPYIDVDSQLGIKLATQHLIALGHQEIGLILPPQDMAYTQNRLAGYREALASAHLPYQDGYIAYGDLRRTGGYASAQALRTAYPQLTAFVACNDLMALGAMRALQELGLVVGEQVAICGYDDIPAAEYAYPSLTTVSQPIYEIGQQLIEMLIKIIQGQTLEESQVLLQPQLIVRASSGAKPAK